MVNNTECNVFSPPGVSTALELLRQCPGLQVTILADQVSPDTTGDGAAGLFSLFLLGDTPLDKQVGTQHTLDTPLFWIDRPEVEVLNRKNLCLKS